MTRVLAIALLALLMACAPRVRGTGEAFLNEAEVEAKDDGDCRRLGAAPGTSVYVDCRLRLRQNRSSEDSSRRLRRALAD